MASQVGPQPPGGRPPLELGPKPLCCQAVFWIIDETSYIFEFVLAIHSLQ